MKLSADTMLPILNTRAGNVPERLLVVGDQARAERVAARLDDATVVSRNREFVLISAAHRGERVGVVSHGVGSAGAAVCFEELYRAGAQRIIRAGTCGGLQPGVVTGALVIAHGAVREDGVTPRLVPSTFPALADVDVVNALRTAADLADTTVTEGVVLTCDLFYPHDVLGHDLALWSRAGAVAVEMECAPLFVLAQLHGAQAGAILVTDGNPLATGDDDMSGYNPHRGDVHEAIDVMITVALDALVHGPTRTRTPRT